ncbi:ABC transporter permease [Arthrobacter sp. L77]|uniref:ABC transporter permease n=1 Tax=Arthrobacter sp. L77 TaxID=1496689 RepID=UPI0005B9C71E|nr:ABC transporter permease [Arthrobacter sp. L77]
MAADEEATGARAVSQEVSVRHLTRVGAKPSFLEYVAALFSYRHFVYFDAKASVQSSTTQDRLGSLWLILNPMLNGLTFFLIFGVLLQAGRGVENFIGYLIVGVFLFQMTNRAITTGARAVRSNLKVIQAFNFPRATLLFSINLRELLASVPVVLTMLVLILLFPPVEEISWLWFLIAPALLLQTAFNLGVGLILARVVARVNDIANFISFAMRLWMYASCVMFPIQLFDPYPAARIVIELNPLYQVLTIVRQSVLYNEVPSLESWVILAAWALGALAVGLVFFWKAEESYGRDE